MKKISISTTMGPGVRVDPGSACKLSSLVQRAGSVKAIEEESVLTSRRQGRRRNVQVEELKETSFDGRPASSWPTTAASDGRVGSTSFVASSAGGRSDLRVPAWSRTRC